MWRCVRPLIYRSSQTSTSFEVEVGVELMQSRYFSCPCLPSTPPSEVCPSLPCRREKGRCRGFDGCHITCIALSPSSLGSRLDCRCLKTVSVLQLTCKLGSTAGSLYGVSNGLHPSCSESSRRGRLLSVSSCPASFLFNPEMGMHVMQLAVYLITYPIVTALKSLQYMYPYLCRFHVYSIET
ncbi:hypothetical protein BT67DRAFT_241599 [Trichocladium antarcticum]|uniref:Uncharacterized protein n=1 Tax=Trichocladium antarcticum TaxID=1450529 RepID=A0AAN6UCN4_9PEZI|nr:hypothetical protein BT67DRAFT_241599 [Trichocladium antarcticum]